VTYAPIPVVPASPERLPHLAGVLARALVSDPIYQWPHGGNGTVTSIAATVRLLYAQPAATGMLWEAGNGAGAAVWVPPGDTALLAAPARADAPASPLTPADDERTLQMWDWLESKVPDDAWYLDTLGVDPARQHLGVGSALVHHGLGLARADHAAAFLETSVEANIGFYQRSDFQVVEEGDAPNGGPHIWFMRWDP